ncbi:maleylpyruvate isomerase family mycothiol-dependent enzyme [Streptomyces sp. YC504]|uniref:Maleylpyruvate isomerase family mycothiol-dependent enzyme n=1 Tax=Streptomyces mesophilus TaxID=1775132 RepID=A0A6G4XNK2_9ACTN|nr:maleylpyruvate isomerase family mycothiol-dependent enzyme [Streptomyces mesophilus]NGO78803.1 maleylpyruvate isomerase family mycothiol-dependent enzyme [Streptomyces mesophilus]
MTDTHDAELPGRLLRTERDALIPLLRSLPDADFARYTCCPGWTVRHVIAHCGSALMRVVESRFEPDVFSPACNDRDIAERADWSHTEVVDELERAMTEAGPVIAKAGGLFDVIGLGEWLHAGDVREAVGAPDAYAGAGIEDALALTPAAFAYAKTQVPVHADLDGRDEPLVLGSSGERPPARFIGPAPVFLRLIAGRPVIGAHYELAGAKEAELNLFGG